MALFSGRGWFNEEIWFKVQPDRKTHQNLDPITTWCYDNNIHAVTDQGGWTFYFATNEHAVLFKLKWG